MPEFRSNNLFWCPVCFEVVSLFCVGTGRIDQKNSLFFALQALDLAAEATAVKEFKDWWWKARLGKCYYKLGERNALPIHVVLTAHKSATKSLPKK